MNELDEEMGELLSQARRALSPTPADEARVLQRTLRAVSAPAVPTAQVGAKLLVALSIAGLSGTIGFALGRRAGHEGVAAPAPVVVSVPSPPVVVEPAPEQPANEVVVMPPPKPVRMRTAPKSVAAASEPVATAEAASEPVVAASEPAISSLELEVRFMKTVERALRDNDPGQALRVLDQLDQEVPEGSLAEERLAASVIARCRLGLGRRTTLIEEFKARYAASAYEPRVQISCRKRE